MVEVFQYDSWTTRFDWNLLVLICLGLIAESVVLLLVWKKHSKNIRLARNNSLTSTDLTSNYTFSPGQLMRLLLLTCAILYAYSYLHTDATLYLFY